MRHGLGSGRTGKLMPYQSHPAVFFDLYQPMYLHIHPYTPYFKRHDGPSEPGSLVFLVTQSAMFPGPQSN